MSVTVRKRVGEIIRVIDSRSGKTYIVVQRSEGFEIYLQQAHGRKFRQWIGNIRSVDQCMLCIFGGMQK